MRVVVEILAPGFALEPWTGTATKFETATFRDPGGWDVQGFRAELAAKLSRSSPQRVADRAVVIAQGLLDLILRWPLAEPQIRATVDGKGIGRSRT